MELNLPQVILVPTKWKALHISRYAAKFCVVACKGNQKAAFVIGDVCQKIKLTFECDNITCSLCENSVLVCQHGFRNYIYQWDFAAPDLGWDYIFDCSTVVFDYCLTDGELFIVTKFGAIDFGNKKYGLVDNPRRIILVEQNNPTIILVDRDIGQQICTNKRGEYFVKRLYKFPAEFNLMPFAAGIYIDSLGNQFASKWTSQIHRYLPRKFRDVVVVISHALKILPSEIRQIIIGFVFDAEVKKSHEIFGDTPWSHLPRLR